MSVPALMLSPETKLALDAGFDAAFGAAAHSGRLAAAGTSGPETPHWCMGTGDVRYPSGDDLVVCHFCNDSSDFPSYVSNGERGF